MKNLVELDMENERDRNALSTVLEKLPSAHFIVNMVQVVEKNGEYEHNTLQTVVAETPCHAQISIEKGLAYITACNLKNANVQKIKTLYDTVLDRGTKRLLECKSNDYYLEGQCVTIDKRKGKSYMYGFEMTPLFASSDGDKDLKFAYPLNEGYISIDKYSEKDADYEAMKLLEKGKAINPLLQDDYDIDEDNE